jgi:hypothetical protein
MPDDRSKREFDPSSHPKYYLEARKMDYEENPGWVGRCIGSSKNAANNIAFVVVVLVLIAGGVSFAFPSERVEIWKTLVPIVTPALGYVFGKNSGKP